MTRTTTADRPPGRLRFTHVVHGVVVCLGLKRHVYMHLPNVPMPAHLGVAGVERSEQLLSWVRTAWEVGASNAKRHEIGTCYLTVRV